MVGIGAQGRPYMDAALRRGMRLAILDRPSSFESGHLDRIDYYQVVGTGTQAWFDAASRAIADGDVDAVIAFSEPHVGAAALIADELSLAGPGMRASVISQDKAVQRRLFSRRGIRQPRFLPPVDVESAVEWAEASYPVVVKPTNRTGSMGVRVVDDSAGLREALADVDLRNILIEIYLDGREYSVECVYRHGVLRYSRATEKVTTDPPYCVEIGHCVPASLSASSQIEVETLVRSVAEAIGLRDGIMHLEFRLQQDGPYLIEFAVRTAGDYIMELHRHAFGVDLYDAAIAVALDEDPALEVELVGGASILFLTPAPGKVMKVEGEEDVRGMAGVLDVNVSVNPGDEIVDTRSSVDRAASVLFRADSRQSLRDLQREVLRRITIHTTAV